MTSHGGDVGPSLPAEAARPRVGIGAVGLGRWARVLATAYTRSDAVELRSCYSRSEPRRREFASEFGCGEESSLEALLARDDVDGVVVTVPNDQHATVIEAAARAGKHVYVEKPLAVDAASLARIKAAVLDAGIILACGHTARRLAGVRALRRALESGEIGVPSLVEVVFSNERGMDLAEGDWRGDPVQCPGGPLTQLGIHQLDNLGYLFGAPRKVSALGLAKVARVPNTMVVAALLDFDDVVGYLGTSWLTPGAFSIDLYGSVARLRYELDFGWWSRSSTTDEHSRLVRVEIGRKGRSSANRDARELKESLVPLPGGDHLREAVEEFAAAIKGGPPVEVGLESAISNVVVVLAIARSLERGAPVEVAEVAGELE